MTQRVAITGVGMASPIGNALDEVSDALQNNRHGITPQPEWSAIEGMGTRLGAPVRGVDRGQWPRKKVRTMGRVALLATFATERALEHAGLERSTLGSGMVGLAYGSTHGSSSAQETFCRTLFDTNSLMSLSGSAYLRFMSHTCAANLAQAFGIRGRIIPTCAACASASQAIGYGYEAVKHGRQQVMICGGAEELHVLHAAVFDMLLATSTRYNEQPEQSPRPFDANRDGLVVGEGAGTVVLESFEYARDRGAPILAELIGFGSTCDGSHMTSPSVDGMAGAMRAALAEAQVNGAEIDYINAHATATTIGDTCESRATFDVAGERVPISSTKGFTGHTLGACGAIELGFCLAMMRDRFLAPNRNLSAVDPECAPLAYIRGEPRSATIDTCMSNNFAFGGINTSLVIRRV